MDVTYSNLTIHDEKIITNCNGYSQDNADDDKDDFSFFIDCDDNNAQVNPSQIEIVYNGIDDDCNSETLDDDLAKMASISKMIAMMKTQTSSQMRRTFQIMESMKTVVKWI